MAGKSKHADRMASHVGRADRRRLSHHPRRRDGRTDRGRGRRGRGRRHRRGRVEAGESDIEIPQFAWLGLGPERFTLTKASAMGKPTGDPVAQIAYGDVTGVVLTSGKASMKADLDLADGRHLAFEIQSRGTGKPSIGVLELLQERCTLAA